ncbi:MAG: class D sortase [Clostridia bacterium]|nr:class D sortase [Clostridia bacterium]
MFKYTTRCINITSFIISMIIFFILNLFYSNFDQIARYTSFRAGFSVDEVIEDMPNLQQNQDSQKPEDIQINSDSVKEENYDWCLEIPNIDLKAQISEGTTKEVMDKFIGHFEESSRLIGNVALAAHNRGYENNYFHDLKKLKEGDEILYTYKEEIKEYIVNKHYIIKDTDLSCLENTEENTITLITCVENEPEYRRCIQGIEK